VLTLIVVAAGFALIGSRGAAADPTCASTLDVVVHGQHVVGDYVTGIGREDLGWPPSGGVVGDAVGGFGAAIPGGPRPRLPLS
jgi:hypothetical protein